MFVGVRMCVDVFVFVCKFLWCVYSFVDGDNRGSTLRARAMESASEWVGEFVGE